MIRGHWCNSCLSGLRNSVSAGGTRPPAGFSASANSRTRPEAGFHLRRAIRLLAFLAAASGSGALTPTEWPHRQAVNVAAPGLIKIALPAATFDAAQPDLADLRVLDAAGQEVPYLLDRETSGHGLERAPAFAPRSFRSAPQGDTTQLTFETGATGPLDAINLETPVPFFLKAAHVEISSDGETWQSLGAALPVFRQFGAEQLRLELGRRPAAFVRVTLDDFRSRRVAFTGARFLPAPSRAEPPALAPLGARLTRRDEFAGETVLTLTLDGRHVPLAALVLETREPLFMRRVTVSIREVLGAVASERTIAAGTLYRVALDGAPARTQLELPLYFFITPTRELLVHIHNGDSPPLTLEGVQAKQHPVNLLFFAPAAGSYTLLSGNPQAPAPRYDLAAFGGEMRNAGAFPVVPGEREAMPGYRPRESLATAPLPDVPLLGAPLDARDWPCRRPVRIERAGAQELELDPGALAGARTDFADLRLLREGNQIPYVLEQPALARSLTLMPVPAPDPKRPAVSVWRVQLPQAGLPLRRLVLTSATPLFQRQFRLYERVANPNGGTIESTLTEGSWSRTPEPGVPETRAFELPGRLRTDTILIETDNGDNPAIALGAVQAVHPVVRLVFKVAETDGFELAYGHPSANAPRYDLGLVAVKLLTSSRNVARLTGDGPVVRHGNFLSSLPTGYIFWAALALVVVVLLAVVAKLLPKPPAG